MLLRTYGPDRYLSSTLIDPDPAAGPEKTPAVPPIVLVPPASTEDAKGVDLDRAAIEVREVTVRQVHVNGTPVGAGVPISR